MSRISSVARRWNTKPRLSATAKKYRTTTAEAPVCGARRRKVVSGGTGRAVSIREPTGPFLAARVEARDAVLTFRLHEHHKEQKLAAYR
jgi:hypothetical protein